MPTTPTIDPKTLAVDYNFAYSVFQSNPELKKLFTNAVANTWTSDKFVAELRGTQWFQHTSATAREWTILVGSDPATAKARTDARAATLKAEAGQLGITMTPAQLSTLTNNSLMLGWTDQQVRASASQYWKYDATTNTAGLAGQTVDKIKQMAADYLVPVSDSSINDWTHRVLTGQGTTDDFNEYAKNQAKSMFPSMGAAIDRGVTVAQYLDPYKQTAAQTLGINPNEVNFMDPKWRKAVDVMDPKTKERSAMSLADWQTTLRTDSQYGYDKTSAGRQQASALTTQLAQLTGFMG